jgi:hypothetical protein
MRPGELALALPRHFSVRDLFKWASRMQVLHGPLLGLRSLRALGAGVEKLLAGVVQRDGGAFCAPPWAQQHPLPLASGGDMAPASEAALTALAGYDVTSADMQVSVW